MSVIWYVLSAVMHMIIQFVYEDVPVYYIVNKDSSSGIGLSKNEGYLFAM